MAAWRMHTLDARIADDRGALAAATQAGNAPLELNALLYGITDLTEAGLVEEAAKWFERFRARAADGHPPGGGQRGWGVSGPAPPTCTSRCTTRSSSSSTRASTCCRASTRRHHRS